MRRGSLVVFVVLVGLACAGPGTPVAPAGPPVDGCGPDEPAPVTAGAIGIFVDALEGAPDPDPALADTIAVLGDRSLVVPQIRDTTVFAGLGAFDGPIDGDVVICEVRADGGRARRSGRNLPVDVALHLGDQPEVLHRGLADADVHQFSLPAVRLRGGASVTVAASSRNQDCDWGWFLVGVPACWDRSTPIGNALGKYKGKAPFDFPIGDVQAECRVLPRARAIAAADEQLARVDTGIDAFCSALGLEPSSRDFGWDERWFDAVTADLEKPAAYVGWGDERVSARQQRLRRIDAGFRARTVEWVAAQPRVPIGTSARLAGFGREIDVAVLAPIECGPAVERRYGKALERADGEAGCVVEIALTGAGAATQELDAFGTSLGALRDLDVLLRDGSTRWVTVHAFEKGGKKLDETEDVPLAPGDRVDAVLLFAAPTGADLELRAMGGSDAVVFALR